MDWRSPLLPVTTLLLTGVLAYLARRCRRVDEFTTVWPWLEDGRQTCVIDADVIIYDAAVGGNRLAEQH